MTGLRQLHTAAPLWRGRALVEELTAGRWLPPKGREMLLLPAATAGSDTQTVQKYFYDVHVKLKEQYLDLKILKIRVKI